MDNPKPCASPTLVLASSSPYRRELLERLRIPFTISVPDIDEKPATNECPKDTALRLSAAKAAVVARKYPNAVVIGSDQVAELDATQIGKPGSHANAFAQLKQMQGRRVFFHSALTVINPLAVDGVTAQSISVPTTVTFRSLSDDKLDAYLRIEKPYDCAGSAKNEGLGIALIDCIESTDPTALTGLPLIALTTLLLQAGFSMFDDE